MAQSPGSAERRANLIREMAQQSSRSKAQGSVSSSSGSIDQPLNDIDTESLQLPALPGLTPSQHRQIRSGNDFRINTSALRRAFPDFSQHGSSDDDSIEVGRGVDNHTRKSFQSDDASESMSLHLGNESFRVTGTPPLKPRSRLSGNAAEQGDLKRHSASRKPLSTKGKENTKDMDAVKQAANKKVQPSVESDDGMSEINENLPPSVDSKPRGSRAGSARYHEPLAPLQVNGNARSAKPIENLVNTNTFNSSVLGTHQSFVLPDLPNITELVSGLRQDGTPLFNRSARSKSRFGTPGSHRIPTQKQGHAAIDAVPIPTDEKALYLALQLLHEKIAQLEDEKAAAIQKADDNEHEVLQLKSKLHEVETTRHSDSGVGFDAEETRTREWDNERSKFEMTIHSLQQRLDQTNKKLADSEDAIVDLTNDQSNLAAVQAQPAMQFARTEELERESDFIQDDIQKARAQLNDVTALYENRIDKLVKQQNELRGKLQRRQKAVDQMSALAREMWQTRHALATAAVNAPREQVIAHRLSKSKSKSKEQIKQQSQQSVVQDRARNFTAASRVKSKLPSLDPDSTTQLGQVYNLHTELPKDETFLSFMDGDEVAKLQTILKEDRAKLASLDHTAQHFSHVDRPLMTRTGSSNHDKTSHMLDKGSANQHQEKDLTQRSMASTNSQRRRRSALAKSEDMTSAFILQDITIDSSAPFVKSGDNLKHTVSVKRPTPVSDRNLEGEDHTIRPSQPPAIALATVLQGLEDEINGLRVKLANYEAIYNRHDPALSKHKRKAVHAKIQKLLAMIEYRADQIYALYDVLEGQKHHGQLMNEEQVDVTLKSVGIDPVAARRGSIKSSLKSSRPQQKKRKDVVIVGDGEMVHSDSENEDQSHIVGDYDDVPWEGIEPTTTLGSLKELVENATRM